MRATINGLADDAARGKNLSKIVYDARKALAGNPKAYLQVGVSLLWTGHENGEGKDGMVVADRQNLLYPSSTGGGVDVRVQEQVLVQRLAREMLEATDADIQACIRVEKHKVLPLAAYLLSLPEVWLYMCRTLDRIVKASETTKDLTPYETDAAKDLLEVVSGGVKAGDNYRDPLPGAVAKGIGRSDNSTLTRLEALLYESERKTQDSQAVAPGAAVPTGPLGAIDLLLTLLIDVVDPETSLNQSTVRDVLYDLTGNPTRFPSQNPLPSETQSSALGFGTRYRQWMQEVVNSVNVESTAKSVTVLLEKDGSSIGDTSHVMPAEQAAKDPVAEVAAYVCVARRLCCAPGPHQLASKTSGTSFGWYTTPDKAEKVDEGAHVAAVLPERSTSSEDRMMAEERHRATTVRMRRLVATTGGGHPTPSNLPHGIVRAEIAAAATIRSELRGAGDLKGGETGRALVEWSPNFKSEKDRPQWSDVCLATALGAAAASASTTRSSAAEDDEITSARRMAAVLRVAQLPSLYASRRTDLTSNNTSGKYAVLGTCPTEWTWWLNSYDSGEISKPLSERNKALGDSNVGSVPSWQGFADDIGDYVQIKVSENQKLENGVRLETPLETPESMIAMRRKLDIYAISTSSYEKEAKSSDRYETISTTTRLTDASTPEMKQHSALEAVLLSLVDPASLDNSVPRVRRDHGVLSAMASRLRDGLVAIETRHRLRRLRRMLGGDAADLLQQAVHSRTPLTAPPSSVSTVAVAPPIDSVERDRREAVWVDALRELTISGDPLFSFLKTLAGLLHEDVTSIIKLEDRSMESAQRALNDQRREVTRASVQFGQRVLDILITSVFKSSSFRIAVDESADPVEAGRATAKGLMVVGDDAVERLRQLSTAAGSQSNLFEAHVQLQQFVEQRRGAPLELSQLIEGVRTIVDKQLKSGLDMVDATMRSDERGAMDFLAQPRNSLVLRLRNETYAAIRSAYSDLEVEMRAMGRSSHIPTPFDCVEGPSRALTDQFAALAAYKLASSRIMSSSAAVYVGAVPAQLNMTMLRIALRKTAMRASEFARGRY